MVGVDIGQDSVKLALLSGRRLRHVTLGAMAGRAGGGPAELLRQMAEAADCVGEPAWGSIQGPPVIARVTTFPKMTPDQLRSAAALEAEELVSRNWSSMDFDCDVLREDEDDSTVLFVAAPKDLSDRCVECLRSAGFRCVGMTTCSLALVAAFRSAVPQHGEGQSALLLDIGAGTTNIVLFDGAEPAVFRDIPFGTVSLGFHPGGAEAPSPPAAGDLPSGGGSPASLPRALEPLCDQISRTLAYRGRHARRTSGLTVYLSGGGSLVPGLREDLSSWLDVPVAFMDPFVGLDMSCEVPEAHSERSRFATSVGNALLGEEQA